MQKLLASLANELCTRKLGGDLFLLGLIILSDHLLIFVLFVLLPLVQVIDVSLYLSTDWVDHRSRSHLLQFPLNLYLVYSILKLLLLLKELLLFLEESFALFFCKLLRPW